MDNAHVVAVRHDADDGADELGGVTLTVVAALDNGIKQLTAGGNLQGAGRRGGGGWRGRKLGWGPLQETRAWGI